MIAFVEPVCKDWVHEEVNAGLINLVKLNNNNVKLYAQHGHIKAIKALLKDKEIKYHGIEIPENYELEDFSTTHKYSILLMKIAVMSKAYTIFIMSAYMPTIKAVQNISRFFPKINFIIVLHAMIEEEQGKTEQYLQIMKKSRKNVKYLIYNMEGKKFLNQNGVESIYFLHHPFIKRCNKKKEKNEKITIGVIGQCVNENALRIIDKCAKDERLNKSVIFKITSKYNKLLNGKKSLKRYNNVKLLPNNMTRNALEQLMNRLDYILIPYGKGSYKFSASGVLWDAFSNGVPSLMYDSSYLVYYNKKNNLGQVADSLEKMYEMIKSIVEYGDEILYFKDEEDLTIYNMEMMRKILEGIR